MNAIVNTEQAQAWNGYEGRHWADNHDRWNAVSGAVNDDLLAAARIEDRTRVLDVGCGAGQTTRLAARHARHGLAVGIDLSGPMLARARAVADEERVANVRFEQGDAQVFPFERGGFDVAVSRGGVLFFADPVAAFANIGGAIRAGGRIAFVCPQDMRHNEWFMVPMTALLGREPTPAAPDAPGMFSFADPARIDAVLTAAGFREVTAKPLEVPMAYGRDAEDAAGFIMSTGPVRHHLRDAAPPALDRTREAVTAALRPYETPGALRLRGAWWLVTGRRPGS